MEKSAKYLWILKWRFRYRSRRRFLNSLLRATKEYDF